jgi:hypothetical protein
LCQGVGIVEYQDSRFKANAMLSAIAAVLVLIPLKSHSHAQRNQKNGLLQIACQYNCTYQAK